LTSEQNKFELSSHKNEPSARPFHNIQHISGMEFVLPTIALRHVYKFFGHDAANSGKSGEHILYREPHRQKIYFFDRRF
jgi:hypothetical protein